jgi:MFS family permease
MQINTFRSFRSRNYRLYFIGQSVSLMGTWMQKTAVSWVVYSLTHSKWMLGVTLFATMFPSFLLSAVGGVAADRYNRYRLLLLTQVISMLQALGLAIWIYSGNYPVWGIIFLSVLLGIVNAFDVPARQSLVNEMVNDKKDLPNALALNSSMVNLSRIIGPALAGLVIERWGDDVCFGLNALSFGAVIGSLLLMRLPRMAPRRTGKKVLEDLKEGLIYIRKSPEIAFVLTMFGLVSLLVLPFSTMIPVYAKDIFHGTASTFGVIDSVIGLGAFSGAIFLASLKPGRNLRKILAVNSFVFGMGLVLFSHETRYPLALAFAALAAFGMMSQATIVNTILQTTADASMRGRVISVYAMAFFGMQPLGGLLVGFVSQRAGVKNTVLAEGLIALLIGAGHLYFLSRRPILNPQAVASNQVEPLPAALAEIPVVE